MAKLALTRPQGHGRHRLVEISEDEKQITLVSALKYNSFMYDHFFEVNELTHNITDQCRIMGRDISVEQALAVISDSYHPNWFRETGESYTDSQIAIMTTEQNGIKLEMEYLQAILDEKKNHQLM